MEPLREIQLKLVLQSGIGPEEFEDGTIFMSMFNDIDWSKGTENSNECFSNSLKIRGYAHRFQKGTLVFSRSRD